MGLATRMVPVAGGSSGDLAIIESIARRTWPATFGRILSSEQIDYMLDLMYRREALEEQLAIGHVFHLLLEAEDSVADEYSGRGSQRYRPVGYVSHEIDHSPEATKIHKIYLLPEVQGRGYGKLLLDHVERLARRAGQKIIKLDVNYQNKAIGFYERLGFSKLERYNTDIGNNYLMEDWRMVKIL